MHNPDFDSDTSLQVVDMFGSLGKESRLHVKGLVDSSALDLLVSSCRSGQISNL